MYKVPCYRVKLVQDGSVTVPERKLGCGYQAARVFRHLTRESADEMMMVACLNGSNQLVGVDVVSRGGLHGTAVTPREVFRLAYLRNASAIIIGHNHPSECLDPSFEDLRLTREVARTGEAIGICLLDHIVVTREGSTSLLDSHPEVWRS